MEPSTDSGIFPLFQQLSPTKDAMGNQTSQFWFGFQIMCALKGRYMVNSQIWRITEGHAECLILLAILFL